MSREASTHKPQVLFSRGPTFVEGRLVDAFGVQTPFCQADIERYLRQVAGEPPVFVGFTFPRGEELDDPNFYTNQDRAFFKRIPPEFQAALARARQFVLDRLGPLPSLDDNPPIDPFKYEIARLRRDNESMQAALATPPAAAGSSWILSLGERQYRTESTDPITVTENEDRVLQAFLKRRTMNRDKLENTAFDDAPRVLRKMRTKYGARFAGAITCPGRRGAGGYQVKIRWSAQ
jgi:hypothetical protein